MTSKELQAPASWLVPGAIVDYHASIEGPVTQHRMTVRTMPIRKSSHWAVWLEGKASAVCVEALTLSGSI